MLSRRIVGCFVCLRCQLLLASRGRTRPVPARTPKTSIAARIAPRRCYSDSPARDDRIEKPLWKGRLPVDEPQDVPNAPDFGRSLFPDDLPEEGNKSAEERLPVDDLKDARDQSEPQKRLPENRDSSPPLQQEQRPEYREAEDRDAPNPWIKLFGRPEESKIRTPQRPSSEERTAFKEGWTTARTGIASAEGFDWRNFSKPIYRYRGEQFQARYDQLPIDILGKPANTLTMNNMGRVRKLELQQLPPSGTSPIALDRIYESLEVDTPTVDEVLRNIHELQPKDATVLPRRDFEKLQATLFKGFTKSQLAAYIHKYSLEGKDGSDTDIQVLRPWVLESWPWAPETEDGSGPADALLHGYVSKKTTPKERLVIGLMRQCWGLAMEELQSQQGYLDVRVKDTQFDLLMLGSRSWLESLPKSLFSPGTQIELIRSEKIVRIVAPKAAAGLILQEINSVLDKAHIALFEAARVSRERIDQSVLDEAGKITQTVVRYDESGSNIQVSWLPTLDVKLEGAEGPADIVYRLLYSACGYQQTGEATMDILPAAYSYGGWYIVDYHNKGKLAWKDRVERWARWTIATPRQGVKTMGQLHELPSTILSRPLDTPTLLSFSPDGWSTEPQTTTRAVLGHVLHNEPIKPQAEQDSAPAEDGILRPEDTMPYNRNADVHDKLDLGLRRTLAPLIPPLSSLATITAHSATTPPESTLILRFLPSPDNPSLPSLELSISVDPDTDSLTPSSLRAIKSVDTHDTLLPAQAVDIRLSHTTSYLLPGDRIASHCPSLSSFLAQSDLRPFDGVLTTPPRPAPLRLPSRMILGGSTASNSSKTVEASYLFSGLEIRRSVAASVAGWKMSYTSVEAGQGGGRRAELALEGVPFGGRGEEEETDFERFERVALEERGPGGAAAPVPERQVWKGGPEGYVETLSRLVLGKEFSWFGEMPEREGREGEERKAEV